MIEGLVEQFAALDDPRCASKVEHRPLDVLVTSCAEAQFHFQQCGLSRLDGDRDGVPCERLCR